MAKLIKSITVSTRTAAIGESILVTTVLTDPHGDITINNIFGGKQWIQYSDAGTHWIVVTATLGNQLDQGAIRVKVRAARVGVPAIPILWASQDPYLPRTVHFSIG